MKTIITFFVSCFTALAVMAQTTPTVTIKVNGSRNKEIRVDGQAYTVNTDVNSVNGPNTPIVITGLLAGQHTLQLARLNQNNTNRDNTTSFTLRSGYDLLITVNGNGSIQLAETRIRRSNTGNTQFRTPVSDAVYNTLLQKVQSHLTTSGRTKELNGIVATTSYYFTTIQAKQLIQQSSSQATRLALSKTIYKQLTDPANYTLLNDLLTSQAYRNELATYVATYNKNNPRFINTTTATGTTSNTGTAMSVYNFNQLYAEVQYQSTTSAKTSYLTNVFSSNLNYFTVAQVRQLLQLANAENDRLALAKLAYDNVVDPANYTQVYDLFSTQTSRNELAVFISGQTPNVRTPMATANFNSIYQAAREKWPTSAKVTYINSVFENAFNYLTTSQTRQLIQLVYAENDRLQLAKAAYDNITDPTNFAQLYDLFNSQATRDELAAFVRTGSTGTVTTTARIPMAEADYNKLYEDISNRWGLGIKFSTLTEVFNNVNYYFSTAQAKQLIQLVSSESNRLTLAKASYKNITDPENFSQIYDIFTSQASKNELAAYVNSYSYNK